MPDHNLVAVVRITIHNIHSCSEERFVITVDNDYNLYFDGVEQTDVPDHDDWHNTDSLDLSRYTRVIALRGNNTLGVAGILASTPDGFILTNSTWKCSNTWYAQWNDVVFNDSSWQPAVEIGLNGSPPWFQISSVHANASWIWNNQGFTDLIIYCRLNLR